MIMRHYSCRLLATASWLVTYTTPLTYRRPCSHCCEVGQPRVVALTYVYCQTLDAEKLLRDNWLSSLYCLTWSVSWGIFTRNCEYVSGHS
ncbi:hypothetical protein GGS21DRAFT_533554 [Xylaria nigripes]|nr:hypothetical protein GGS21DRAFT_533554 [Xylaria nigripes]